MAKSQQPFKPSARVEILEHYARAKMDLGMSDKDYAEVMGMNPRTLRKLKSGQTTGSRLLPKMEAGGGRYKVTVENEEGDTHTVSLLNPLGQSKLKLFTPKRTRDIDRAVEQELKARAKRYKFEFGNVVRFGNLKKQSDTARPTIKIRAMPKRRK